jgi:hypothetical protein
MEKDEEEKVMFILLLSDACCRNEANRSWPQWLEGALSVG